jgi:hypothetical protein
MGAVCGGWLSELSAARRAYGGLPTAVSETVGQRRLAVIHMFK